MSQEAKVGTFVVVSIIIFVYTFIRVANVQVRGERNVYKTYFRFAGGLEPGNVVRFAGIKAGGVTAVQPWEEDPTKIEIVMEIREGVPVNEQSKAMVAALSPLGTNYLEISPGTKEARRLEPGETIPSEEAATLADVISRLSSVAENANTVLLDFNKEFKAISGDSQVLLANLQEITGDKNQKSIELLLENSNQMIAEQRPKFDRITDQVSEMLEKVDKLTEDLRQVAKRADTTVANVNRTVEETREPLKKDLAEMEATLVRARLMLEDIQALVAVNQEDIRQTIENFRMASENVEQLTDELRQRPWSLIRGKPKEDRRVPLAQ